MKIPATPPSLQGLLASIADDPARLAALMSKVVHHPDIASDRRYRHWDKLRHLRPPEGLTLEEWWWAHKFSRSQTLKPLPLLDVEGRPFRIGRPDAVLEVLPSIDSRASGAIAFSEQVTNAETRDRYLVSSLIEEAVTSSQLEGAATTGRVAREMIRSGRRPRDRHERMIANGYAAMEQLRGLASQDLSPEMILDLHAIVTEDTLEEFPGGAGRFRAVDEDIHVHREGVILHTPPPAKELGKRVERLCAFANGSTPDYFIHPVVRSTLVHFWLAYDHPFVDGNGRTARALFYWSMLRHGYWMSQYLSISSILRKAPAQYARAFLYSETDENDSTYFVVYQLGVLQRALNALEDYIQSRMVAARKTEGLLRHFRHLNHRQAALLAHAIRHPSAQYDIKSHQRSHAVVYETARRDLLAMEELGLLLSSKRGNRLVFDVPKDLNEILERLVE